MSNYNDRNKVKGAVDLLNSFKNDHPHKDVKIILDDGEIEASKGSLKKKKKCGFFFHTSRIFTLKITFQPTKTG